MVEAVIVDIVRTASGRGKRGGALSGTHSAVLLSEVLRTLVDRSALDPRAGWSRWFLRTVRKPATIAVVNLRPGQRVFALIQSANRDPRMFDDPDTFRWDREITRTLAFGHGPHFCIGVHLARLEGTIVIEEWLRRVPEYSIDEASAVRSASSFQWGWTSIPVEVQTSVTS